LFEGCSVVFVKAYIKNILIRSFRIYEAIVKVEGKNKLLHFVLTILKCNIIEWMQQISDCCLTPNLHFFSYIKARTSYIRWYDDDLFVLDQHAQFDFYSASTMKQQSAVRHVAPLEHFILILSETISLSLVWQDLNSNRRSTTLEASTLTIR